MKYLLTIVFLFIATCSYAADKKITELGLDTSPDGDSLLVLVDDPDGSATNLKTTITSMIIAAVNSLDTSAEIKAEVSDETGSGALVFATSPTLVTPALGTIASGEGNALTNLNGENIANDTIDDDSIDFGDVTCVDITMTDCGAITSGATIEGATITEGGVAVYSDTELDTSSEIAGIVDDETGTGLLVFGTSPTVSTPVVQGKLDVGNGTIDDDSCVGEQGFFWYDTTDSSFEFCNANSGAPVAMAAAAGDVTDVFDCASGDCNDITVENGEELKMAIGGEIHSNETIIPFWNASGAELFACTAVYLSGYNVANDLPEADIADADDDAKMPAVGLVENDTANGAAGWIVVMGSEGDWDTNGAGWSTGDDLYVNDSGTAADDECSNTLTSTRPANDDDNVQKVGTVIRDHVTLGQINVSGANRSNDVPNLLTDMAWVGNASNVAKAAYITLDMIADNGGTTDNALTVATMILSNPLSHEDGGLEADTSTYDGLVKISGGATSYVADRSSSWEQATTNVLSGTANRMAIFNSSGVLASGGLTCYLEFVVDSPNSIQESAKRVVAGENRSGNSFTITEMHVASSDTIPNAFVLYINDVGNITDTSTAVEAKATIDISGNVGATTYDQTSGFDNTVIADDKWLVFDWDTGTPTYIKVGIWGYW